MAKNEYVKLWLSYRDYFESYSAAEVGRLVLAMIEYRESGAEPEFSGSERFVWPAIRRDIDAQKDALDEAVENGKKGGRPKKGSKPKETPVNPLKGSGTENNQGQGHCQGQGQGQGHSQGQGEYPPTPPRGERATRFTPPTVDDVRAYCQERGNHVDPETFVDFYAGKGWKVGRDPMKDWKACVRTWEKRDEHKAPAKTEPQRRKTFSELIAEAEEAGTV